MPRGFWAQLGFGLAISSTGCAAGAEADATGFTGGVSGGEAADDGGTEDEGTADATATESDVTTGDGDGGPDLPPDCGSTCDTPPSDCFEPIGACIDGSCEYSPLIAGSACGNPCGGDGVCDAMGTCLGGGGASCDRPNTTGGTCGATGCEGWTCATGWADCNTDWDDGCETDLSAITDCGSCGNACGSAGPNASVTCDGVSCGQACTGDYENCDGDWANGCEIPTGVANQCSDAGLDPVNGCWTAWCGSSTASNTVNFGTYYCAHCSNCNTPSAGMWRWCSSSSGVWFPADVGTCSSADEDLVCSAA